MQRLQPRVPSNSSCQWLRKHLELSLLAAQSPFKPLIQVRCATHGAQGRANGPKNSPGRRLGAKKTGDEYVVTGNIIFRQRGTHWFPGENVGMGRDHTIFALQSGYVRYYRDPHKHPKRQYIGVVFDRAHRLPTPQNAARRRRLGMVVVPRVPAADTAKRALGAGTEGGADAESAAALTKRQAREVKRKKMTGRLPVSELEIRSDYSYRESNWQIGRAAERAGVKVKLFKKGDRFLAWRKKTARIARNAEKRAMGRAKNSKPKAAKTNTRPATPKVQ